MGGPESAFLFTPSLPPSPRPLLFVLLSTVDVIQVAKKKTWGEGGEKREIAQFKKEQTKLIVSRTKRFLFLLFVYFSYCISPVINSDMFRFKTPTNSRQKIIKLAQ